MKKLLLRILFFIGAIGELQANNAPWVAATGGDWNTDTNWAAPHPDAQDASAGFVGFPTSAGTITSTTPITIGSLVFDTTTAIAINLGNNLTFDRASGNAEIFDSGTVNNTIFGNTILNSDLDIFVKDEKNFFFRSSISGAGTLTLFGEANSSILHLYGNNSYTGNTFVFSGFLELDGADNITNIPGDINIFFNGNVRHLNNNNYSTTTKMTINGGSTDLSGTQQTMKQVSLLNGGFLLDSAGTGILDLLAAGGIGEVALMVANDSQVGASLINLINGGGISYDSSRAGTAFIHSPTIIDLQGQNVNFNIPHNSFNCTDTDIGGAIFQNGVLNKTGNGMLKIQGGTVPTFNIEDGTVIIGDQNEPSEIITATGLVTVLPGATLGGFQLLEAQAGVINSGTVAPADACTGCATVGTLTIQGSYTNTSLGSLTIKALNASTSDQLVVDGSPVILSGELNFDSLPGAIFSPGDEIVVLDNINEEIPIAGTFSSFVFNLSPCLTASIIYAPHQVIVKISACPSPSSSCSIGQAIREKYCKARAN